MQKKFSIRARLKSFQFAIKGLQSMILEEHNARIHLVAAIVVIIAGVLFQVTKEEWLWLSLAITLVFITEMINTAVESMCDEITEEISPNIKKAKDVAAGAVLVVALFAVVVAVIVFVF